MTVKKFQKKVWQYYAQRGRTMPWRETTDPYHIMVSEIMLQQTQVDRVAKKYQEFIAAFPNVQALAGAPLIKILRVWAGMGYNRRALYLQKIAQRIVRDYNGRVPRAFEDLACLPGVGPATACSIAAFAFNAPVAFIETNIRSVFIHEFYPDRRRISDRQLMPLVQKTIDRKNPREWYYALMDYGALLKKQMKNPSRRSTHHAQQSAFKGSNRELRGQMVRALMNKPQTLADLMKSVRAPRQTVEYNLNALQNEGLLKKQKGKFAIS